MIIIYVFIFVCMSDLTYASNGARRNDSSCICVNMLPSPSNKLRIKCNILVRMLFNEVCVLDL